VSSSWSSSPSVAKYACMQTGKTGCVALHADSMRTLCSLSWFTERPCNGGLERKEDRQTIMAGACCGVPARKPNVNTARQQGGDSQGDPNNCNMTYLTSCSSIAWSDVG
jgi:hypothetical protein